MVEPGLTEYVIQEIINNFAIIIFYINLLQNHHSFENAGDYLVDIFFVIFPLLQAMLAILSLTTEPFHSRLKTEITTQANVTAQ